MDKKDHPRGLCPEEREEWQVLCKRLFELYRKMPMGSTARKVIAGGDKEHEGNMLMLFKGSKEDLLKLRKILG